MYYNFYVYKYATGFAAAQIFARRVLKGGDSRDRYIGLLEAGSSRDPLDTVREAGADLADPSVVRQSFGVFSDAIDELSKLLEGMD